MSNDAPVGWVAAFAGAYLVYAAVTDRNPIAALTDVLSTGKSSARPIAVTSRAASIAGTSTVAGAGGAPGGGSTFAPVSSAPSADQSAAAAIAAGTAPLNLTSISGGGQLAAPAAVAYQRASQIYGRPIPITGAYRSLAVQASAYATDPERFAPPSRSLHPKGLAIDVNSANMNEPALIAALSQTGWAQTALPKEPWHWSFGVRG